MSFSFGFSGDDIEGEDLNDATTNAGSPAVVGQNAPPPIPAQTHDLDEMVGKSITSLIRIRHDSLETFPKSSLSYPPSRTRSHIQSSQQHPQKATRPASPAANSSMSDFNSWPRTKEHHQTP
jgi:hypothetical protein